MLRGFFIRRSWPALFMIVVYGLVQSIPVAGVASDEPASSANAISATAVTHAEVPADTTVSQDEEIPGPQDDEQLSLLFFLESMNPSR